MEKIIPNGTEVLIFKYVREWGPNQDDENYIVGTIKSSRMSDDMSIHGSLKCVQIYEVLGEDGNRYIGTYGNGIIGNSFFRTKEDHIKILKRKQSTNREKILKLQEKNFEYDKQIGLLEKEIKKNDKNKYKLFGMMNMFGFIPDFVYPVFENNGKYYFQNSDNSLEIDSFHEIIGENHIKMIRALTFPINKLLKIKDYYIVGDEPLVVFQMNENDYFIGTSEEFLEFTKHITIENEMLYKGVSDFQNEIKLAKSLRKEKIN